MEQDEEKTAKEKESIAAMRLAQKHMADALSRVSALERALGQAADSLSRCTDYIPEKAYTYDGKQKLKDVVKGWETEARKLL